MSSKKIPVELKGYTTGKFLGKGSFANVFSCYKNGEKFAMKRVNSENRFKKCALKEIEYLEELENPNIIKMEEHFIDNNIQYLVFEFMYDNMFNHLVKNKNYPSFDYFKSYAYQLADGLSYLHNKGIVHCDLKLENVMINYSYKKIKIIDLGSSIRKNKKIKNNFYIQSRYYRAPEILYRINFNEKIDIWSYGVLLTEIILRRNILDGRNSDDMVYKIVDYLDIPKLDNYVFSDVFENLFLCKDGKYFLKKMSFNYKIKGYREGRLEDYLINGLNENFMQIYKYQIDNVLSLISKILTYDFNNRISADQCMEELLLLEHKIDNRTIL